MDPGRTMTALRRNPTDSSHESMMDLVASLGNGKRTQQPKVHRSVSRGCVVGISILALMMIGMSRLAISLYMWDAGGVQSFLQAQETLLQNNNSDESVVPRVLQGIGPKANKTILRPIIPSGRKINKAPKKEVLPIQQPKQLEKALNKQTSCIKGGGITSLNKSVLRAYHSPYVFEQDFREMLCYFKIFIYPHSFPDDDYSQIFFPLPYPPGGNYASESAFKKSIMNSSFVTKDPSKADLFYMPFSIARMRNHAKVGPSKLADFVADYVANISRMYPYWNRTGGADHFFVACHSISKAAMDKAVQVKVNAIQVVCSSSYFLQSYIPHKDATIPQIWPRGVTPANASSIKQRTTLAFFAGKPNSDVRIRLAKSWADDPDILVFTNKFVPSYSDAQLTSKFCLHVKGYEVNTARLGDAMHYGCVPVIIANHHDLPYNDVIDYTRFAVIVATDDIPLLKRILTAITPAEYEQMQRRVMQVRKHFEWHSKPKLYDAFYMVMYELWLRRHYTRAPLTEMY